MNLFEYFPHLRSSIKQALAALLLTLLTFSAAAAPKSKVVVIPFLIDSKVQNVIQVSPSGGDFIDPIAAMESILDASAENQYVIVIGPGVYNLKRSLIVKNFVSVIGSGNATILRGRNIPQSGELYSAVVGIPFRDIFPAPDLRSVSNLRIESLGGGEYSTGISIGLDRSTNNRQWVISDVSIYIEGGSFQNTGVKITDIGPETPVMRDSYIKIPDSQIAKVNYGIEIFSASPNIENVTLRTEGQPTSSNSGIYISLASTPNLNNIDVQTSFGFGVYIEGYVESSPAQTTIRNSSISGFNSLASAQSGAVGTNVGGLARIVGSELRGFPVTSGDGIFECLSTTTDTIVLNPTKPYRPVLLDEKCALPSAD